MATLHIEHAISDFEVWSTAFGQFADARRQAGVRTQRIQRPLDDPAYVVVDLEFGTVDEATAFRKFLEDHVWSTPAASPALAGKPRTMILVPPAAG